MTIRCIVLDMDRTTLNAAGRLSAANRAAIEYAISRGVEVIPASGRSFSSLPEDVIAIPGINYAITSNGAAVYRMDGECLIRHLMDGTAVKKILALISDPVRAGEITCEGFMDGVPYCSADYYGDPARFGTSAERLDYVRRTRCPVADIVRFIEDNMDRMDCIDLIVGPRERKEALWARLEEEVDGVYITTSAKSLLEISDKGSGKHAGVRDLLGRLGISPGETAAFGDEDNDAGMLAFVGVGVAVSNASDRCKRAADDVTDAHDEDGVAKWILAHLPGL